MTGHTNYKTSFLRKLFLTKSNDSKICKVFINNLPGNIKLSKAQLSKMIQSDGYLGRLLRLSRLVYHY